MRLPTYENLDNALQTLNFGGRVSEWHGFLCGVLALNMAYPLDTSIGTLAPDLPAVASSPQIDSLLPAVFECARAQMTDPVLQLELLLPNSESADLTARVNALASWCDGFLFGLANAGLRETSCLPADTKEILSDLTRISQLDGADTGDEDEEISFHELLEYVRVSVLLVAEELQPMKMTTELQ